MFASSWKLATDTITSVGFVAWYANYVTISLYRPVILDDISGPFTTQPFSRKWDNIVYTVDRKECASYRAAITVYLTCSG